MAVCRRAPCAATGLCAGAARRRCLLQFSPALLQIQKPAHWPVRPANRRPGRGDNQAVEPRISGVVTLAWVRVKTSVPSDCVCGPFA